MLKQVADGVWVRQSAWVWSNAIAVRGERGLILVDPGIDGSDLNQLADDLDRLGIPIVAGFSTHPHWDHLLWHPRFGDVPRYATPAGAHAARDAREQAQRLAAESASGDGTFTLDGVTITLEGFGLVSPLPADGGPVPGEIIEHQAHAVGHAAVLLADRGVLLAGDMLSDVLIPLLDARRPDQVGAYEIALDRLGEAARDVDVLIPGHGSVAEGPEVAARLAADHAYIDALRRAENPVDARLGPDAPWLPAHHSNLEQARGRPGRSPLRFTIAEVEDAHDRFGTTSTLPQYLRALNAMGVARSDSLLADGHSEYFSEDGYKVVGAATHERLVVAGAANVDEVREHLRRASRGESNYVEMSKRLAASGIAKWTFDTKRMTISYCDVAGNEVLREEIR